MFLEVDELPKIFRVKVNEESFVMKIYRLFEQIFEGNANWYEFAIGSSTIFLLVLLQILKTKVVEQSKASFKSFSD